MHSIIYQDEGEGLFGDRPFSTHQELHPAPDPIAHNNTLVDFGGLLCYCCRYFLIFHFEYFPFTATPLPSTKSSPPRSVNPLPWWRPSGGLAHPHNGGCGCVHWPLAIIAIVACVSHRMRIFVTVGTTKFDALIEAITNVGFLNECNNKGIEEIIIQHGHSPSSIPAITPMSPKIRWIKFIDVMEMASVLEQCHLVIGHGGSGTALDVLRGPLTTLYQSSPWTPLPLVLVPNQGLMDNHQIELAAELQRLGCVCLAEPRPESLITALDEFCKGNRGGQIQAVLPDPSLNILNDSILRLLSSR